MDPGRVQFRRAAQADQADLARAQAAITYASTEIQRLQDEAKPDLEAWQQELTEKQAMQGQSDADLARQNLTSTPCNCKSTSCAVI